MKEPFTPVIFHRHTHQLRAVLIDRHPWFVGLDFGRLIGTGRPYHLPKRMDPEQKRAVVLEYLSGFREEVEVISESGAYKALYPFWHPEHRNIAKWVSDEVLPPPRHPAHPRHSSPARLHDVGQPTHRRHQMARRNLDRPTRPADFPGGTG
ncbi:BRO-N domain-containing protein [Pseudomonas nicosulfuronedens]